ncbi:MAG: putative oxidoreductase [Glaciecola sp.]|jgi:putative oxidoreductase
MMSDADAMNLGLLILRVSVGSIMLAHGWNHVFGGGKIAGTAGWFTSLGMKPGILHAWLASITEIGAGVLLILGLLTPLAAAGVVGTMGVAWITNHRSNGFFIFRPGEGWEYVMSLTVSGAALAMVGPGEWSLDAQHETLAGLSGATGALLALGGALSAGLLLAAFWRPEADPTAKG